MKKIKKFFKIIFGLISLFGKFILGLLTLGNYWSYKYGKYNGKKEKFYLFTVDAKRQIEVEKQPTRMKL